MRGVAVVTFAFDGDLERAFPDHHDLLVGMTLGSVWGKPRGELI